MSEAIASWIEALIIGGFSSMMCLVYVVPVTISIAALVLWIIALVDVVQRDPMDFPNARDGRYDANERVIWIVIVVFGSGIGALVYYLVVMRSIPRRR